MKQQMNFRLTSTAQLQIEMLLEKLADTGIDKTGIVEASIAKMFFEFFPDVSYDDLLKILITR